MPSISPNMVNELDGDKGESGEGSRGSVGQHSCSQQSGPTAPHCLDPGGGEVGCSCGVCRRHSHMDINKKQKDVAGSIGKLLVSKGINFAGIDMIGDYLTEINITSPTCAREIFNQSGKNPIQEYFSKL